MKIMRGGEDGERIRREASAWIDGLQSDNAENTSEFDTWLRRDPRHGWEFLELTALDVEIKQCGSGIDVNVDDLLRRADSVVTPFNPDALHAGVQPITERRFRIPRRERASLLSPAHLGAFACLVAILGAALWWRHYVVDEYDTQPGEYRLVRLEDGSRMHLNSATHVRVQFHSKERHVELTQGEALFDVVHDPSRPFLVAAGGATAQALGTQFDVKLDRSDLRVTVNRGRVAVVADESAKQKTRLEITDEQLAIVDLTSRGTAIHVLASKEKRRVFAWADGIGLNGTPLREAVARFNAANTVQIAIDDPEAGDVVLGGQFSLLDPEGFVRALEPLGIMNLVSRVDDPTVIHLFRAGLAGAKGFQSLRIEPGP